MRVLVSLNPCQHLVFCLFCHSSFCRICNGIRVVLIYILLMVKDIKHLFMCLLTICISSLEKYLFTSFAHFFFLILFIYFYFFGCAGSSFLCVGFLQLRQVGATLHRGARASHCRGLSCCGAQAPDAQAQ